MKPLDPASPYFVDFPGRVRALQAEMARAGIDLYLGSRLRTLSWVLDAFCPWRSFVVVPAEGPPAAFTFVIDAARLADETWLPEDRVFGFAPMGGQDQIELIADFLKDLLKGRKGRVGIESGMSNYLPEGNLTHYEFERFRDALPGSELVNAHDLVDRLSLIKDAGTIARFREASRIVDVGHRAVFEALRGGGWKGLTETEIAGLAALAGWAGLGTAGLWADIALVWLTALAMIAGVIVLAVVVGAVVASEWVMRWIPPQAARLHHLVAPIPAGVGRGADALVRPVIVVRSVGSALAHLFGRRR